MMMDQDPAWSKKVTEAVLEMVKLDIAALEEAYWGEGGYDPSLWIENCEPRKSVVSISLLG